MEEGKGVAAIMCASVLVQHTQAITVPCKPRSTVKMLNSRAVTCYQASLPQREGKRGVECYMKPHLCIIPVDCGHILDEGSDFVAFNISEMILEGLLCESQGSRRGIRRGYAPFSFHLMLPSR